MRSLGHRVRQQEEGDGGGRTSLSLLALVPALITATRPSSPQSDADRGPSPAFRAKPRMPTTQDDVGLDSKIVSLTPYVRVQRVRRTQEELLCVAHAVRLSARALVLPSAPRIHCARYRSSTPRAIVSARSACAMGTVTSAEKVCAKGRSVDSLAPGGSGACRLDHGAATAPVDERRCVQYIREERGRGKLGRA
ncbi:hypothetical protein DFH09DRAFT_1096776 [Mycena vulgaris]|nr:hypothetical protein DFH09DRAFT_1096776 [Mycena vulgaris]